MAFVDNSTPVDPNNPNSQAAPVNPVLNQAPQTATAAAGGAVPGAAPQGAAAQPSQSKAPQYQDLGAYLNANAPQTQQLAQNVATGLGQQYTGLQGNIDSAVGQFNGQVQQNTVPLNQPLVDQALASPASFVNDPNNVSAFQGQLNAKYNGPTDFTQADAYSGLNSAVQNAAQIANNASTPGGLQTLVAGNEKNPTAGETALDAALLGGNPTAIQTVQQAAQPLGTLGQYLANQTNAANQGVQGAQATSANTAQSVQDALAQAAKKFSGSLTGQLTADQAKQTAYNQAINDSISKENLINQQLYSAAQTDLNPVLNTIKNQANATQPAATAFAEKYLAPTGAINSFNSWLANNQPIVNAPTMANTATADQYAQDAALAALGGSYYTPELNPANASQAGTFNIPDSPAALPDVVPGEMNYMQDLSTVLRNPAIDWGDLGTPGSDINTLNPQQLATLLGNPGTLQNAGQLTNTPYLTALENLINNAYGV